MTEMSKQVRGEDEIPTFTAKLLNFITSPSQRFDSVLRDQMTP